MRFIFVFAIAALWSASSPVQAARLLYRGYTMDGTLYGAMLFDTSKPYDFSGYPVEGGPRGYFVRPDSVWFNGLRESNGFGTKATFAPGEFIGQAYSSGLSNLGSSPPGANRPADAQLHQPTPDGPTFGTGTFHVYAAPTDYDQPADQYVKTARITVTDIGDATINFFAQVRANGSLEMFGLTWGDELATEALPQQTFSGIRRPLDAFRLTGVEGSTFVNQKPESINSIIFIDNPYTTDWSSVRTERTQFNSGTLFDGGIYNPNFDNLAPNDPTEGASFGPGRLGWVRGEQHRFIAARSAVSVAAVPEPATWLTMVLGFGIIGSSLRRRQDKLVFA